MLSTGVVLQGRYEVIKPIGQGGMGAVYLARDQRLGNTVALKETFFSDSLLLAAFEREAKLLAGLRHVALPKVIDHFADTNGQFLVMEYIPGDDLQDLLQENDGPFPANEVLNWADQLLDALNYLHMQQPPIIHRDIKPQNLKLTISNQIVLLDFGLAKGTPIEATQSGSNSSIFGYTPSYAPLEQAQGTGTDQQSDIYSLSATLYHLLTGKKPVDAATRASYVLNGQPDPIPPIREINPLIAADLSEIIMSGMALKKDQRPSSAAKMRSMIGEYRRSTSNSFPVNANSKTLLAESKKDIYLATALASSTRVFATEQSTPKAEAGNVNSYTTRVATTNLRKPGPTGGKSLSRVRPDTVTRQKATTVEISGDGSWNLSKVIIACTALVIAVFVIAMLLKPGSENADTSKAPIIIQKTEQVPASAPPASAAKTEADVPVESPIRTEQVATSEPAVREEQPASSDAATKAKEVETVKAAEPVEAAQETERANVMKEPEVAEPAPKQPPRRPEDDGRGDPFRPMPPPPHHLPGGPPPPFPPPPQDMPPGRRRP